MVQRTLRAWRQEYGTEAQLTREGTHVVTTACSSSYLIVLFLNFRQVILVGMAEIHAGTAADVDRAVFPLAGGAVATARIHRSLSPRVVVELA